MHETEQGQASNDEVVRGVVQRITFRNPENGYSVLQLGVEDERETVTVVGHCLHVGVGTHLLARGNFKDHPKFGRQLVAEEITETAPETSEGIEKYLGSGRIKGIGPKTAALLVKTFGTQTLKTIYRDPDKIARVPGIGRKKAGLIVEAFARQKGIEEVQRFFIERNISTALTGRIFEKYGLEAVEKISQDPYLLAHEMQGVGFATADSIALNLGLNRDSPQRLKAGLYWALEKASEDGHCFLDRDVLIKRTRELLGLRDSYDFDPLLIELEKNKYTVCDGERIYIKSLYEAEEFVADFVTARSAPFEKPELKKPTVEAALQAGEKDLGIKFSYEQREAVYLACEYPLLLITGGPGCGKTTIIRALTALFKHAEKDLALAAPTGKAAQRMAEVCGVPACTIHRLLKYDPIRLCFYYGINNPLKLNDSKAKLVDAVIIDEASMIDIQLARSLFSAIPAGATLILVGDKDQLPSVGPGRMFADLLALKDLKAISLSHLFRRSEESRITRTAHMINSGLSPDIPRPDGETKTDAYFIEKSDPEQIAALVESLVTEQIPRKFNFEPDEITVLTPSNRGPLGTIELNRRLQDAINPNPAPADIFKLGQGEFRKGDRVCQRKNNYNIDEFGVFNGDIGKIYDIDHRSESLTVDLWDGRLIRYDKKDARQLSLAYALTVHRSQGSELPCVIMVLHDSHFILLERQLFYTGLTRAKKLLVLIGTTKAISIATKRLSTRKRQTYLQERILEKLN